MKIYWRYYLRIILWVIEDFIVMKEYWNDRKKIYGLLNYEKKLGVVEKMGSKMEIIYYYFDGNLVKDMYC